MHLVDIITKGSADCSVPLTVLDSTGAAEDTAAANSPSLQLWYRREGGSRVSVTQASLASLAAAHSDGGLRWVGGALYRLDLPDAAFATGASHVDYGADVPGGGLEVIGGRVLLIDANLEDSVRLGLTALPNAAAAASGGLFTRGTGAGQINQDANGRIDVNVAAISTDSTAADNLETAFDDTAGPVPHLGIVDQGTAQSASSTSVVLRAAAAFGDDTLIGCVIGVYGSTQGYWQFREITDNVGSTDTVNVDAWAVTPSGTISYKIFGAPAAPATPPAVDVTRVGGSTSGVAAMATNISALATTLQAAGGSPGDYEFSRDALRNAPTGSGSGGSGLDAAGVRAAVGLAAANLDTQLANIKTPVDHLATTIEAASGSPGDYRFTQDALEMAPAGSGGGGGGPSASSIAAAVWGEALPGSFGGGSAGNIVGTNLAEVAAIKIVTDALWTLLEAAGGSPGEYRLSADALRRILDAVPTAVQNADALLARDIGSGANAGTLDERTVRAALRFLRNKWAISGTTMTVRKEDDSTTAWTAELTTTPSADPVTGIDPT